MAKLGNLPYGTVFFALEQTQGKGQRSKTWESKPGENIVMSIYTDSRGLTVYEQVIFSFATSLAAYKLLKKYAGDETSIKWPNDIYWRDRKAGGILIENVIKGNSWDYSVIGIGININQTTFEKMDRQPVSLKQITGKTFDPILLAKELCIELESILNKVGESPLDWLISQYNDALYKKGQSVTLKKDNIQFDALIKGVNKKGNLVVEQGFEREYVFGEVSWVF